MVSLSRSIFQLKQTAVAAKFGAEISATVQQWQIAGSRQSAPSSATTLAMQSISSLDCSENLCSEIAGCWLPAGLYIYKGTVHWFWPPCIFDGECDPKKINSFGIIFSLILFQILNQ